MKIFKTIFCFVLFKNVLILRTNSDSLDTVLEYLWTCFSCAYLIYLTKAGPVFMLLRKHAYSSGYSILLTIGESVNKLKHQSW